MRKAQKQEMLEMVQTLHQAHDEIKNNIEKKNYVLAQDMLSQCQECAISIGTAIEKFEGEGFVTVSFVEAYCDVLFSIYEELNGSDVNANKIYKNLKKQLLRIENSIKNDVPIRKEVAFFPYKASMWDALESVYLAAKEDPDCDAYCVPIPYYDRNPDKSLGQMHYEGNEYPKNIEIVDWQTYNFEERKPDAIYIHNPYDDWNLVTCVHPRYFSANLKKYTEKLVYIPYFVLDEIEPDDQARIDGMKHFCFLPGVINADKVVVQSEKMRQIYINEYQKAAQANGLPEKHIDRKQLEEKFLGTGSPKFDKVLNTKKEDLDIPEEWLKIIQKPDGSWKKIIFYNTSIAALLEHNEKMLEKMKDVFQVFKENKDEVALLWRPHPLIKSTVSSMRPQLWVEYEKMVKQYKEEGWGIYDDSSDMDRAVVLSDAYYGDTSSLVRIFRHLNKAIMMQNPHILKQKYDEKDKFVDKPLLFENLYDDGKYYWFTSWDFNALFRVDKSTWQAEYIASFPNEEIDGFRLYATIIEFEDNLLFTPLRAKEIAIYNKKSGNISKISFNNMDIGYLKGYSGWNYYSAHMYKDYIYLLPHQRTAAIKYNIKTGTISTITDWIKSVTNNYVLTAPRFIFRSILQSGKIYAPISGCNLLEKIDLETQNVQIIECGEKGNTYADICNLGEKYYIAPLTGNQIVEYDEIRGTITTYLYRGKNDNKIQFWGIVATNGKAFLFPNMYESVMTITAGNGKIMIQKDDNFLEIENKKEYQFNQSEYIYCTEKKGKISALNYKSGKIMEISDDGNTKNINTIQLSRNSIDKIKSLFEEVWGAFLEKMKKGFMLEETENIALKRYLYLIKSASSKYEMEKVSETNIGKKIYKNNTI